jgi:hypothetical protein
MFTYFTDRDGKYQLGTLKESAFDPLSRTCEFMLKEEAHHMFVGTTGIDRVVTRTAELMREHDTEDIAPHGGIPLDVIQKYVNFHYSVSLDLFGSEKSTNAANYFTAGLKGRWQEERRKDDHVLTEDSAHIDVVRDGAVTTEEVSALIALNHDLRTEYVADCATGMKRWNRVLREGRDRPAPRPAARRLQPGGRPVPRPPHHAEGRPGGPGRVGGQQGPVAAHRGRQGARPVAHAAGLRAREDRRLDRPADEGHQRQAGRLRVRAPGVT